MLSKYSYQIEEFRKNHYKRDSIQYNLELDPMYIKFALIQNINSLFGFEYNNSPFVCGRHTFDKSILGMK